MWLVCLNLLFSVFVTCFFCLTFSLVLPHSLNLSSTIATLHVYLRNVPLLIVFCINQDSKFITFQSFSGFNEDNVPYLLKIMRCNVPLPIVFCINQDSKFIAFQSFSGFNEDNVPYLLKIMRCNVPLPIVFCINQDSKFIAFQSFSGFNEDNVPYLLKIMRPRPATIAMRATTPIPMSTLVYSGSPKLRTALAVAVAVRGRKINFLFINNRRFINLKYLSESTRPVI